jgi:predicted DNA-binding transcriptional regulator AlpA
MGIPSPSVHNEPCKRLFTEKEAAHYIGMSPEFLRKGRIDGPVDGRLPSPRYKKLGVRAIRYDRVALDEWIDQFEDRQFTSEAVGA